MGVAFLHRVSTGPEQSPRWRLIEPGDPTPVGLLLRTMSNRQGAQAVDGVRQDKERHGPSGQAMDGGTQPLLADAPGPGGRALG